MANKSLRGRNPPVAPLHTDGQFRHKVEKSTTERSRQKDQWDRGAKYKKNDELSEDLHIGDEVEVTDGSDKNKTGMVKKPNGPMGLVGISIEGEYMLIPADKLKIIKESLDRMIEISK